jgi:hypothetical protein
VPVGEWAKRYGPRLDSWQPPSSKTERDELALVYGYDGFALLEAVYAAGAPGWLREVPAVQVLRTVWLQNYHRTVTDAGQQVRRRESGDLPPARTRLVSPYDTDARYGARQQSWWTGYKIHISETCDEAPEGDQGQNPMTPVSTQATCPADDSPPPRLITNIATTDASVTDVEMTEPIHRQLAGRGLLPGEHYLDSGYASAELIIAMRAMFGIAMVTPVMRDSSPQARAGAGFDRSAFAIDWDKRQATCPRGSTSTWWSPATQRGTPAIVVKFDKDTCDPCPVRDQCTRSKTAGRTLSLQPRERHELLEQARAQHNDPHWRAKYAIRAGVEGTVHQAVATCGIRRTRYRGLPKTHLEHIHSAVALNLLRLDAWWSGRPLDRTRTGHLARLDLFLAA